MKTKTLVVTLFSLIMFAGPYPVSGQTDWQVVKTFQVGGLGGWDYLTVDPQTHRLYVPRTTHTMVVDAESGKTIADIPGQKNAHGVAVVPDAGRGFITDGGGDGAIVVFDLKTNEALGSIVTTPDTDGIIYDPFSKQVIAVSGDKGVLMTLMPDVDPKSARFEPFVELGQIAAGEVNDATIARGDITEGIQRSNRETLGDAGRCR